MNSPNTGIVGYSYDAMGNMIGRNGDTLVYNAQNKLQRIETIGGDKFEYTYDHSGMRIKKSLQNSNTTTYSFGNYYEIHRSPGVQEKHTLYVIGAEEDMVAQYSRGDVILLNQMASNEWLVNPFCKDVNIDCETYWKNKVGFVLNTFLEDMNIYKDGKIGKGHRVLPWLVLLGFLFWVVYKTKDQREETNTKNQSFDLFGISILPNLIYRIDRQIPRYGTALFVVLFTFTTTAGCFPLLLGGAEGESGTPIWMLGLGNIPSDTQSVGDEPPGQGGGGGGSSTGNARVTGMYFFHPDHLGSITMITDGNGNVLAGGERGGKSHITYKPYGEILRTDSYGPDITKFKYTGQEEDQESGLYYYKSRYYDSNIARFVSNDGMVFPDKDQGMNRMMYVEGNPLKWRDRSGNRISTPLAWGIMGALSAQRYGLSAAEGFALGYGVGNRINNRSKRFNLKRSFDNTLGNNGAHGWLTRNAFSTEKISRWYNRGKSGFGIGSFGSPDKYENTHQYAVHTTLNIMLRDGETCKRLLGDNCANGRMLLYIMAHDSRKRFEDVANISNRNNVSLPNIDINIDPETASALFYIWIDYSNSKKVQNGGVSCADDDNLTGTQGCSPADKPPKPEE
ncbi:RHS repeat domain-containing protein [Leptospira biflexa]|uniref:RHS repeat domain-containing protein n=1 Tax=Leptospira biflexa TaxID=172 RepID=UPI0002D30007|nr:RHS repeat-associated core domain-containing protein [Leptospira biflexa]